jgi:hypothetical protein
MHQPHPFPYASSTNIISGGKSLFTFKGAESKKNGMKALSACRENVRGRVEREREWKKLLVCGVLESCRRICIHERNLHIAHTYSSSARKRDEGECVAFIMLRERMQTQPAPPDSGGVHQGAEQFFTSTKHLFKSYINLN